MKLLIGLGNPGLNYFHNRHNVGFQIIEAIALHLKAAPFKKKFKGLFTEVLLETSKLILFKPQTYMNLSGYAVAEVAQFYKISNDEIYVFQDDMDVNYGKVKVKKGGSSGGHNGIKSIDALIGNMYNRIRIGIGHPGHKDLVTDYVLGNFSSQEQQKIHLVTHKITEYLPLLVLGEQEKFMNNIHAP